MANMNHRTSELLTGTKERMDDMTGTHIIN